MVICILVTVILTLLVASVAIYRLVSGELGGPWCLYHYLRDTRPVAYRRHMVGLTNERMSKGPAAVVDAFKIPSSVPSLVASRFAEAVRVAYGTFKREDTTGDIHTEFMAAEKALTDALKKT